MRHKQRLMGFALSSVCSLVLAGQTAKAESLDQLSNAYFDQYLFKTYPTEATQLGVHQYDDVLEDYSKKGIAEQVSALKSWMKRLQAISVVGMPAAQQDDRDLLMNSIKSQLLTLTTIKPWENDPDFYSSFAANSAFSIMARDFAPGNVRMKALTKREVAMVTLLQQARENLVNPPKIYTEIALEQLPGIIHFFENDVPLAFEAQKSDPEYAGFLQANQNVVSALQAYQSWLTTQVLPHSKGQFRLGERVFREKLKLDEMVDLPIPKLLALNRENMKQNQADYQRLAATLFPGKSLDEAIKALQSDHPEPNQLLANFQARFDDLIRFIEAKHIITIPSTVRPSLEETPPFMRAITLASMDTPGPFETHATKAFFNVTLPQPDWTPERVSEFMGQFSYPSISSVAIHETYPGHYVQFLWLHNVPSRLRQVLGCSSNAEGWAHYAEQMMLDAGFGEDLYHANANDPAVLRLRMGELEEALLRNARFEVAIQLHTGHWTLARAENFFVKSGYQPRAIAVVETKRATQDPMYLYYTLGKLEILKLRHDLEAKQGQAFNLQQFHDDFMRQGYPPIKVVRHALMGDNSPVL